MSVRGGGWPTPHPGTSFVFVDAKGDPDLYDQVARLAAQEVARQVQAERDALSQAVDEVAGADLDAPSRRRARL